MSLWWHGPLAPAAPLLDADEYLDPGTVVATATIPTPSLLPYFTTQAVAASVTIDTPSVLIVYPVALSPVLATVGIDSPDILSVASITPTAVLSYAVVFEPAPPTSNRVIMPDARHGQIVTLPEGEDPAMVAVVADEDVKNLDSTTRVVTYDVTDLVPE